tara:strand:+ start:57 stop:818 length:762 start_codon:yes stop_codon:yes gene_type:complete
MLKDKLIKFGLSEREANVYLGMLELGTSLVTDIAKKSKENRSTTYVLLDALAKKGLVSVSDEGKIRKYTAAPPDRIVHLMEESISRYNELLGVAEDILPELKNIYKEVDDGEKEAKPHVQLFEGLRGIKAIYEDILGTKSEVLTFVSDINRNEVIPNFFPKYYKELSKKHVKVRALFPNSDSKNLLMSNMNKKDTKALVQKDKKNAFESEIGVYDNKLSVVSFSGKYGLLIDSRELANTFRSVFELSWVGARI